MLTCKKSVWDSDGFDHCELHIKRTSGACKMTLRDWDGLGGRAGDLEE